MAQLPIRQFVLKPPISFRGVENIIAVFDGSQYLIVINGLMILWMSLHYLI